MGSLDPSPFPPGSSSPAGGWLPPLPCEPSSAAFPPEPEVCGLPMTK